MVAQRTTQEVVSYLKKCCCRALVFDGNHSKLSTIMADNNDVDNLAAAGGGEGVPQPPENDPDTTYIDTEIEEVTPIFRVIAPERKESQKLQNNGFMASI